MEEGGVFIEMHRVLRMIQTKVFIPEDLEL